MTIRFTASWRAAAWSCLASAWVFTTMAEQAQLRPPVLLLAGSNTLSPGSYAIPCVTDWNGDGRKDLVVGYRDADKVALYLNAGTDARPVFTNFTNLQAGGFDIKHPAYSCGAPAPWVCDYDGDGKRDWNNDGVVDLLLGNAEGTISCFDGYRFRFTSLEAQAGTRCAFQWNSAPYLKYHVLGGSTLNSLSNLLVSNLPSGGHVTCWTNPIQTDCEFYRLKVAE